MKIVYKRINVLFLYSLCFFTIHSQMEAVMPQIGKQCPDFTLDNVQYYPRTHITSKDFRGKWFVLDFWATGCVACIKSFPKIDSLQREFKDDIQFMLIGYKDNYIEKVYQRFSQHYNLHLALAYDTSLFRLFGISTIPHFVIINEDGNIVAITNSDEINREHLKKLISRQEFGFTVKNDIKRSESFDANKPLLVNSNGGADSIFLYRSIMTQWNRSLPVRIGDFTKKYNWSRYFKNGIQVIGASPASLYRIAYSGSQYFSPFDSMYGNFWPQPILEIPDSQEFYRQDIKNLYCYSLIVPDAKAKDSFLQPMMQRDLHNFFGYTADIQVKKMPCWKLTVGLNAKESLITKGGKSIYPHDRGITGLVLKNMPVKMLISYIIDLQSPAYPIIDETGINGNIDISLEGVLTDFADLTNSLKKNGLYLVKGEREMKVICLR